MNEQRRFRRLCRSRHAASGAFSTRLAIQLVRLRTVNCVRETSQISHEGGEHA